MQFPDRRYTLHDIIAEGDKVVARWTLQATHEDDRRAADVGSLRTA
jgi:predicted ester cyclase